MSEEVKVTIPEAASAAEEVKAVEEANTSEAAGAPEPEKAESMEDYAKELEASYKEFDENRNPYAEQEGPDAEKWANLAQMMQDKTVTKVKVKEAVKAGVIAYIDDIQGFIPASQISTKYVEKLEDWVGQYLEVVPITVDLEKKRLVLSGKAVQKEKEAAEKAARMAEIKVGAVVEGVVDSLKDYGAFVNLDGGLTGLLHVSQISKNRIKHPGAVLKEGQKVTVKIIKIGDGRISLSMKALEPGEDKAEEAFDYKETGSVTTNLGTLLKGIEL